MIQTMCDNRLYDGLVEKCNTLLTMSDQELCRIDAILFHAAVVDAGWVAFEIAQMAACRCLTTPNIIPFNNDHESQSFWSITSYKLLTSIGFNKKKQLIQTPKGIF